jgi:hypothetical protein
MSQSGVRLNDWSQDSGANQKGNRRISNKEYRTLKLGLKTLRHSLFLVQQFFCSILQFGLVHQADEWLRLHAGRRRGSKGQTSRSGLACLRRDITSAAVSSNRT